MEETFDLVEILKHQALSGYESWPKKGKIWPSDLGTALGHDFGGCQVAFYLKCKDAPQRERSPGEILMFGAGDRLQDQLEAWMYEALPAAGWWVISVEERDMVIVEDGERVSGRLDIKIRRLADGHVKIIDVKTKRSAAFKFLNEPKDGDVLQVQFYIAADNADSGGILYADREGQNFLKYFDVERDDHRPRKAITVLRDIRDAPDPPAPVGLGLTRKENKGPDSVYLTVPWQIDWCDLKECACKAALPCTPPKGIVAKLHEVADDLSTEIRLTPAGKPFAQYILPMLEEQYPDEVFRLSDKEGK